MNRPHHLLVQLGGINHPQIKQRNKYPKSEQMDKQATQTKTDLTQTAQDLLYATKVKKAYDEHLAVLKNISLAELVTALDTPEKQLSFWINVYNAFIQIEFAKTPNHKPKDFFTRKCIPIAQTIISFDFIEHGILRRSKFKYSLGYFNKLFPNRMEKMLRVKKVDYRIHFALNCGARSCPPIAFYTPEKIHEQLDLATTAYLESESIYHPENNSIEIAKLMFWFKGDFGGKKGVWHMLRQFKIIPPEASPKIIYRTYDWTLVLDNFS
ncbi:MAG TPA: DUF547 domain-containing protein [Microscillaceae bacterium]|nr:DUF547 domain-containing protein [Microscillaceae bacterium]